MIKNHVDFIDGIQATWAMKLLWNSSKKNEINMGLNFLMKVEFEVEDEDNYFFSCANY